jgi:hypothetical protein
MDGKLVTFVVLGFFSLASWAVYKFKKVKVTAKAPGGFEGRIEGENPEEPARLPAPASAPPAGNIPTDTLCIVMNPRGSRWDQGSNKGEECVFVYLQAMVTSTYQRPVELVKCKLLPSGHEGFVGVTRFGPGDYPGPDRWPPHRAIPTSMTFMVLPRGVCPAAGDSLTCGVIIYDQYGKEHKKLDITVPFGG